MGNPDLDPHTISIGSLYDSSLFPFFCYLFLIFLCHLINVPFFSVLSFPLFIFSLLHHIHYGDTSRWNEPFWGTLYSSRPQSFISLYSGSLAVCIFSPNKDGVALPIIFWIRGITQQVSSVSINNNITNTVPILIRIAFQLPREQPAKPVRVFLLRFFFMSSTHALCANPPLL